jgi:methionyl aminopeptidase
MAVGTVTIKTEEEIDLIRESAMLVGKALGEASKLIEPGASTLKMDQVAEECIRDHGGVPAFKNYKQSPTDTPFPGTLCISVNEEVVHGIPHANKFLQDGDIVSVDCGVYMNGYYGDCAYTFAVGNVPSKKRRLMKVTNEALYKGLENAIDGKFLGDVSHAIQYHVESYGYSIVREMVGHGIGENLHEPPEVPNYGRKRSGLKLAEGMVLAIEPMVNLGRRKIVVEGDGWTIRTSDRSPSAHYEHTVVIRKNQCEVLSSHDFIVNKI